MQKPLYIATLVIGAVLGASALSALATGTWNPAPPSPPSGNVDAPINVGSGLQEKLGSLLIDNNVGILGNLIIATGTPAAGKVLTAVDGTGTVTWGTPSAGSGGSGGGSEWISIPLNDSAPFDQGCAYRFTPNHGQSVFANMYGTNPIFYATGVDPQYLTYIAVDSIVTYIKATKKTEFRVGADVTNRLGYAFDISAGNELNPIIKIEKNCGGSGGGTTATTTGFTFDGTLTRAYRATFSGNLSNWIDVSSDLPAGEKLLAVTFSFGGGDWPSDTYVTDFGWGQSSITIDPVTMTKFRINFSQAPYALAASYTIYTNLIYGRSVLGGSGSVGTSLPTCTDGQTLQMVSGSWACVNGSGSDMRLVQSIKLSTEASEMSVNSIPSCDLLTLSFNAMRGTVAATQSSGLVINFNDATTGYVSRNPGSGEDSARNGYGITSGWQVEDNGNFPIAGMLSVVNKTGFYKMGTGWAQADMDSTSADWSISSQPYNNGGSFDTAIYLERNPITKISIRGFRGSSSSRTPGNFAAGSYLNVWASGCSN